MADQVLMRQSRKGCNHVRVGIERVRKQKNSNRKMESGLCGLFIAQEGFTERTRGVNRGFFQYLVYIKNNSPRLRVDGIPLPRGNVKEKKDGREENQPRGC